MSLPCARESDALEIYWRTARKSYRSVALELRRKRSAACAQSLMDWLYRVQSLCLRDRHLESHNALGVEVTTRAALEFGDRRLVRYRRLVHPARSHGIEGVGNGDYASLEWYLVARQAERVALSVNALV